VSTATQASLDERSLLYQSSVGVCFCVPGHASLVPVHMCTVPGLRPATQLYSASRLVLYRGSTTPPGGILSCAASSLLSAIAGAGIVGQGTMH
jgi:hypothetical protein